VQLGEDSVVSSPALTAIRPHWQASEGDLRDLLAAELRRGGMPQAKARASRSIRTVRRLPTIRATSRP
jgi:hypothetical protein